MKFRALRTFQDDYRTLPAETQTRFGKAIRLLAASPRHSSLRVKKMKGTAGIWEASVTLSYRFTFNWQADVVTLRRIGTHSILDKE